MNIASKTAVIVEDNELCSSALQFQLEKQGYTTLSVCKSRDISIEQCRYLNPALVVLDYFLEVGTGMEVWNCLRYCLPGLKAIFVISDITNNLLSDMLETKPSSIIQKGCIEQMKHAVASVESGGHYYSGDVWERISMYNNTLYALTEKERIVFKLLANNTSEFIADEIGKSVRHVRNYKYNIIQKIGREQFDRCCSSISSQV